MQHNTNRVSVIMPVYNVEKYIDRAIESIINQSFQDWELIVVDDCSTDKSINIAKKYADQDGRIKIVMHEFNRGVSLARNTGICNAIYQYICFVDPDDYCGREYLQAMIDAVEEEQAELVVSGFVKEYSGEISRTLIPFNKVNMSFKDALVEMVKKEHFDWSPCDKLFLREKIVSNNVFFSSNYKLAEDLDFCWRYLKLCKRITFIPSYQYHYVMHYDSATHKKRTTIRLTSVSVMKACYDDDSHCSNEIKQRMLELYVKESASCLKDIITNKDLIVEVNELQRIIRSNVACLKNNKDFSIFVKLAIVFFCLPYGLCRYFCIIAEWMGLYEKLKRTD